MALTISRSGQRVVFSGDTFPAKEEIKRLGAHWDADKKSWWVGATKAAEAQALCDRLSAAPAPTPTATPARAATPGVCACGRAIKGAYTTCFNCSPAAQRAAASGACVKCGSPLDRWERTHGVRRCADCRDGGGNARGGQSYTDRHGNFVLGDDD